MLMAADDTAKLRGGRSCCRLPAASARTPTGTGRPAEPAVPRLKLAGPLISKAQQ